jgi:hypothetical protein
VPPSNASFRELLGDITSLIKRYPEPLIVHDDRGLGPTGVMLACLHGMESLEKKFSVDIVRIVASTFPPLKRDGLCVSAATSYNVLVCSGLTPAFSHQPCARTVARWWRHLQSINLSTDSWLFTPPKFRVPGHPQHTSQRQGLFGM